MRSDKTLKAWYREINTRFFDSQLPDNVCVKWGGQEEEEEEENWEEKYNGYAKRLNDDVYHFALIVLNNELRKNSAVKLSILAHEMCHVASNFKDSHGECFDRWHKQLVDRGFFKKGALLKGMTVF